jgi:hypothetical protein
VNELRILRINFVGIRKIFKRDVFFNLQKKSYGKWDSLFEVSLEIFSNWTKFLTCYVNYTQKWNCATEALNENNNEYPDLKENQNKREGENSRKNMKIPDYVELMLNFKKFIKKKLKCNLFFKFVNFVI